MSLAEPGPIEVRHRQGHYRILIEAGLLHSAAEMLAPFARDERLVVVSDTNVWEAQGPRLRIGFAGSGIRLISIIVRPGERSKSWPTLIELIDRLVELGVERSDTIIAFGGGVVGDLAGFAASVLKRGCNVVQVPTSLLAQVDSSVGGKTGINLSAGKNLAGAFHHPRAVMIDPGALETLPARQLRSGYAEMLKMGLIGDPAFFGWCEQFGEQLIAGDIELRTHAIRTSIAAKARIVAADEMETKGIRQLLNLGHSFGHALEAETGFGTRLLHGEAVALGMLLGFRLSAKLGLCGHEAAERLERHLQAIGLPTSLQSVVPASTGEALGQHMRHDKKASGGKRPLILARGIGEAFVEENIELAAIAAFLDSELGRKAG